MPIASAMGWSVSGLPHKCCCGSVFSVDHAMTCHKGGYPSIRHIKIREEEERVWRKSTGA